MLWGGKPLTRLAFLGKRKINNLELEVYFRGGKQMVKLVVKEEQEAEALRLYYTEQVPGQPRATQTLI